VEGWAQTQPPYDSELLPAMTDSAALRDSHGLALSTRSTDAVLFYIEGVDRLLSQSVGAETALAASIEADEGFALGHAALAAAQQASGKPAAAKEHISRAAALAAGSSRRERQHVQAIETVLRGESLAALDRIREHLDEFPRDILLVHQANSVFQFYSHTDRQQRRFAFLAALEQEYGDDWFFLSAFGFAHHELDLFEESRRLSERSLELQPANANATHNLGHVYYETNDHSGGAAFLGGWLAGYDRRAPMHCHLSWHLALAELAQGHYQSAMEVFEANVSPVVASARTTLVDASSFLWRWQIYECGDGTSLPWELVCDLAGRIAAKPGVAFADAHTALAYAANGDDAATERLIDGLRALDASGHPLAGQVLLPLVHGIAAFARGDYLEAACLMEPVAEQLVRIGGSNAQREVFQDTLLEAYLRSGRYDQAEALLRKRLDRRSSARDWFSLGSIQAQRGQSLDAATSLSTATAAWDDAEPAAAEQRRLHALQSKVQAT
jgi:tetratricopeptide (TPR) repeat protein